MRASDDFTLQRGLRRARRRRVAGSTPVARLRRAGRVIHPGPQPRADLLRRVSIAPALLSGNDDATGSDPRDTGEPQPLCPAHPPTLASVSGDPMSIAEAAALTRTGDLWLFQGYTAADRTIRLTTNSPVNHVGMAIAPDDLPPLMWHAELGRSLPDVWSGEHCRGAQLHVLTDAVITWAHRYGQRAWLRPLEPPVTREMEDAALRTVGRLDGTPFPALASLAGRWVKGRTGRSGRHRREALESAYCAEIVATTYVAMGLLPRERSVNWYDPGRFWSGDGLKLLQGAHLGAEIEVIVPPEEGAPQLLPSDSRGPPP